MENRHIAAAIYFINMLK